MSTVTSQRVLAVKLDIPRTEEGQKLYQRIRDLGWQAAHYRNAMIRRRWAEAMGWRVDPEASDKHDVTKQGRRDEKGKLSGAAYSAAEREVSGAWTRLAKQILAGRPLPEWKPEAALSIRGHKRREDSGVRIELEDGQFIAYLAAQNKDCEGGCWLRCPIAKNTARDELMGDILSRMVSWHTPIAKATVQMKTKRHQIILRLTYAVEWDLPAEGKRTAILGPLEFDQHGRLHRLLLRTDLQTRDYTSKLLTLLDKKDRWDLIRRRALAQIGRRRGHARLKRKRLANMSWQDWLRTHLHIWSRDVIDWCESQGIGALHVIEIDTGDWPAYQFIQMLTYKGQACSMTVDEAAPLGDRPAERAAKQALTKHRKKAKRRRDAVRELMHQVA